MTTSSSSSSSSSASESQTRIYEGSSVTVKGEVAAQHADLVQEVIFKIFVEGEKKDEKTVAMSAGTKDPRTGAVVVTYEQRAADVPADKESYFLDCHVFYKVKKKDGSTETQQNLAIKKFEVLPRTAQLKVTGVKEPYKDKAFPNFQFKVFQAGQQVGGVQSTFAQDTTNAKGEKVPAGTAEFNLDLKPGFRIVQASPFEITEEKVGTGRKREVKGDLKFRAVFAGGLKPGNVRQLVNLEGEDEGRKGRGHEVIVGVAVEGDEDRAVKIGNDKTEVHFRVTFGPASGDVTKSKRKDDKRPTKAVKVGDADKTATIEEKKAGEKYQGKVTLGGGVGYFKVALGDAGGDTCKVEIAGSDKFLSDEAVPADQAITFQNWRRVHYELLVPDCLAPRALSPERTLAGGALGRLQGLGRDAFIEFELDGAQVFDAMEHAGDRTLLRRSFLQPDAPAEEVAYALSGRNWRDLPETTAWLDKHPGKTLAIAACDAFLKWRKDTGQPKAGTKDLSATLTAARGSFDMQKTFGGLLMPFSGDDGGDGVTDIAWTADISKDDACCKVVPALAVEDVRAGTAGADALAIGLETDLQADGLDISFAAKDGRFAGPVSDDDAARVQGFVDELLEDRAGLAAAGGKASVRVSGPADSGKGEDACFAAVKAKLGELFADSKKDFAHHPGIDAEGNARKGSYSLDELSDVDKSNVERWHYQLPEGHADGTPAPGEFVGPQKTATKCPVKVEFSVQPHEAGHGAAEGKLCAWVCAAPAAEANLVRVVLDALGTGEDKAAVAHGHGDKGKPGDCLEKAELLCAACVAFARSRRLDAIG